MRRRELIALLVSAAASSLSARAQQPTMPVIGYLNSRSAAADGPFRAAFRQGLNEVGIDEGRNATIEYRWAEFDYNRLPALAADLVDRQAAVIFATTITAALSAKAATRTIPIVFAIGADPVKFGLVASLGRPSENVTGVTWLGPTLAPKRLELLHELVPTAKTIAVLVDPGNSVAEVEMRELKEAAGSLRLQLSILNVSSSAEIENAFVNIVKDRADAVLVATGAFLNSQRHLLVELTRHHALPTAYPWRDTVTIGGLMSYGTSFADAYRQAGIYTARALKGERPTDLAVVQSTKIEFVINLKTAKALGLTVPLPLLGRADEVIE